MNTFFDSKHYFSDSADPGQEISQLLGSLDYSTFGVIIDGNVPFDGPDNPRFAGAAFVERLYGGEASKTLPTILRIIAEHQDKLDKNSLICTIGGGALLDLAGLCCGLMYRGIRYVSVPTTVIAMADAAYGGKTAVNLEARNQIGMYHHPQLVYVNASFLNSLPDLHVRSGMIEIAKLAIFFRDIRGVLDDVSAGRAGLMDAVLLAATRKLQLLEHDPFEESAASVLLYGHPFGNAFESYVRERSGEDVPHGFAVALGILFSSWLAGRLTPVPDRPIEDLDFLSTWIDPVALTRTITPESGEELSALLLRDKYASNETLRVPAICGGAGYTPVPLRRIEAEYDAWRARLLKDARSPAPGPRRQGAGTEELPFYIAGKPSDETVAPLRFRGADGPFLLTTDGRRMLDWSTSLNAPFGHSRRINTATLPVNSGNYPTVQRDLLVERLQHLFPYMSGFQFRSSGTEAVEASLRYVSAALGPDTQMVAIEGCYHGLTLGARNLMGTGDGSMRRSELPFSVVRDQAAFRHSLESLLLDGPVALWLEGVQGATLRRLPAAFLEVLRAARDRHPGRLAVVADDMLASIRCGEWCSLTPSLEPDLIIGGKSWANGYPFSFFGVAPWIRSLGGDILGTTTYGGNPIACAHAVFTIDRVLGARILPSLRTRESAHGPRFAGSLAGHAAVLRTEWHGLLFGIELAEVGMAVETARRMATAGVLVSQLGPVIRCSPPLDIHDDLLEQGLAVLVNTVPHA
jgi:3-dehydroquinate synthetase/acetylornithine/succinyldiaminopimelate/putrescine aminotransferase